MVVFFLLKRIHLDIFFPLGKPGPQQGCIAMAVGIVFVKAGQAQGGQFNIAAIDPVLPGLIPILFVEGFVEAVDSRINLIGLGEGQV